VNSEGPLLATPLFSSYVIRPLPLLGFFKVSVFTGGLGAFSRGFNPIEASSLIIYCFFPSNNMRWLPLKSFPFLLIWSSAPSPTSILFDARIFTLILSNLIRLTYFWFSSMFITMKGFVFKASLKWSIPLLFIYFKFKLINLKI
jgi:hypothetical protein